MNTDLLRLALKLDAVATVAVGLAMAGLAPILDDLVGAPAVILVPTGLFLVAYAAAVWFVGTRPRISPGATEAIIVVNVGWVALSAVAVLADWLTLTVLGTSVALAQAAAVLFLAGLQYAGLRRSRLATRAA